MAIKCNQILEFGIVSVETGTCYNQTFTRFVETGKLASTVSDTADWTVRVECVTDGNIELSRSVNNAEDSKLPAEATPAYTPGFLSRMYAYKKIKDLLQKVVLIRGTPFDNLWGLGFLSRYF